MWFDLSIACILIIFYLFLYIKWFFSLPTSFKNKELLKTVLFILNFLVYLTFITSFFVLICLYVVIFSDYMSSQISQDVLFKNIINTVLSFMLSKTLHSKSLDSFTILIVFLMIVFTPLLFYNLIPSFLFFYTYDIIRTQSI